MRAKGIAYDTGFVTRTGTSVARFDPVRVERELTIIRDDLHCSAVQIIGGDPARLEVAARFAATLGLEVWFSPYPLDLTNSEILLLFADCAQRAEVLSAEGAQVVFVTGVELSLMNRDFIDGDTIMGRADWLLGDPTRVPDRLAEVNARLDPFIRQAVATVREHFRGKITYAAIQFENIDWELFDIITLELIRSADVADMFRQAVRKLVDQPKPVAITGFGAATWKGAGDVAPRSMDIVEHDEKTNAPRRLNGRYQRDEDGQAEYLNDLLQIFDTEGVDSTFVYLFALENFPHRPDGDPRDDLDLASVGIVKVFEDRFGQAYPDLPWEPKEAFAAVAANYAG